MDKFYIELNGNIYKSVLALNQNSQCYSFINEKTGKYLRHTGGNIFEHYANTVAPKTFIDDASWLIHFDQTKLQIECANYLHYYIIFDIKNQKYRISNKELAFNFIFYNESIINIYKLFDHRIDILEHKLNNILTSYKNINYMLEYQSSLNSAEFILKNMYDAHHAFIAARSPRGLLEYSLQQIQNDGLILEFGVYKGYTISIIAQIYPEKTIYGFDCFEGLPERWRPGFEKGVFHLDVLPDVPQNVHLIQGLFQDTLEKFLQEHSENISFIHIDSDLYSSAKYVLSMLKDRIVQNTVIVFDEYYNYISWENGEYKAFMEFIQETGKQFNYIGYAQEQVAVIIL